MKRQVRRLAVRASAVVFAGIFTGGWLENQGPPSWLLVQAALFASATTFTLMVAPIYIVEQERTDEVDSKNLKANPPPSPPPKPAKKAHKPKRPSGFTLPNPGKYGSMIVISTENPPVPGRFHLDDSVPQLFVDELRRCKYDITTACDVGLAGAVAEEHLAFGFGEGRILVTFDIDILILSAKGLPHSGIACLKKGTTHQQVTEICQQATERSGLHA